MKEYKSIYQNVIVEHSIKPIISHGHLLFIIVLSASSWNKEAVSRMNDETVWAMFLGIYTEGITFAKLVYCIL